MPPDPYGRRCPLLCISRARPVLRVLPSLCRFLQETVTKQLTVLIQTNVPLPTNRKRARRQERPCGIVSPEKHFSRPEMFHDSSGKHSPPSGRGLFSGKEAKKRSAPRIGWALRWLASKQWGNTLPGGPFPVVGQLPGLNPRRASARIPSASPMRTAVSGWGSGIFR